MFTVKVLRYHELNEKDREQASNCMGISDDPNDYSYLVVFHNGKTVFLEDDNIEPEDVKFHRDLCWIPDAISWAYELGRKDKEEEIEKIKFWERNNILLWKEECKKFSKRKIKEISYRTAILYCETCEYEIGEFDLVTTSPDTYIYCDTCSTKYIEPDNKLMDKIILIQDFGNTCKISFETNNVKYELNKIIHWNKVGRFINKNSKRIYISKFEKENNNDNNI